MRFSASANRSWLRWLRLAVFILLLLALVVLAPSAALMPGAFAQERTLYAEETLPIDTSAGHAPNPDAYLEDGAGYEDASLSVHVEWTAPMIRILCS